MRSVTTGKRRAPRAGVLGVALLAVIAGCGGDGGGSPSNAATSAPTTAVVAESTTATSAATPTSKPDRPSSGRLEPDTEYTVADTVGSATVSFRTGADDAYLEYLPGGIYLFRPNDTTAFFVGDVGLVNIVDETDPATGSPMHRSPAPVDLLAWLEARPFFEIVGARQPIEAGETTGEVITVRTKALTTPENLGLCTPDDPICAAVFTTDDGGTYTTFPGEVTELAVFEAAGTKVLVIATPDDSGATLTGTLRITP